MIYKHTQTGHLMLLVLLAVALLYGFILLQTGFNPLLVTIMFFVLFILASFSSLTITIDNDHLRIKFGYGIFKKSFVLEEITSARTVKNHWYYGWGIRFWLWPRMWIYNVSGFDAVEITMRNGKIYRIGTDESDKLERAILELIKS